MKPTRNSSLFNEFASHSCYKACGTFNYVTNAYYDETIIYNDAVAL
jgi:hypothetical protein